MFYVGGVGIQGEQILYFSGGGAVLLGEVLRFSSFLFYRLLVLNPT